MKLIGPTVNGHIRLNTPSELPDCYRVTVVPGEEDDYFALPLPTETFEEHSAILRESIALAKAGHIGRSVAEAFADIERQLDPESFCIGRLGLSRNVRPIQLFWISPTEGAGVAGLTDPALTSRSSLPIGYFFPTKDSAAEFMQYRRPVGLGPSSKTWPKWASQRLQVTSTRIPIRPRSPKREIASSSAGCQKLGQPVPESNLVLESNSSCPQQTQR